MMPPHCCLPWIYLTHWYSNCISHFEMVENADVLRIAVVTSAMFGLRTFFSLFNVWCLSALVGNRKEQQMSFQTRIHPQSNSGRGLYGITGFQPCTGCI